MSDAIFEQLCSRLKLGVIKKSPEPVSGGFTHKMYALVTSTGKYAVKLLNPQIIQRKAASEKIQLAEKLECILDAHNIPIISAIQFQTKKLQEIDGHFFYVYPWYDGRILSFREIEMTHCSIIGKYLANIHSIERYDYPYRHTKLSVDWELYIQKLSLQNPGLSLKLDEICPFLYESQEKSNTAITNVPPVVTICHNDLDSKNVLWNGSDCKIIDLESMSYSSPFIELYKTALRWSGYELCHIDYGLFGALIKSYADFGGSVTPDWETICNIDFDNLEWLEYNLKRSIGLNCTEDEKVLGTFVVKHTIDTLSYYYREKERILNCLQRI